MTAWLDVYGTSTTTALKGRTVFFIKSTFVDLVDRFISQLLKRFSKFYAAPNTFSVEQQFIAFTNNQIMLYLKYLCCI